MLSRKQYVGLVGSAGTVYAFGTGLLTSDMLLQGVYTLANNQVTQSGFCFMLAAWLHSKIVIKDFGRAKNQILEEMKSFSQTVTDSIDGVTVALRADLATKASREEMQARFDKVHERIDALEK
jgi:hypothetical protein